MITTTPAYSLRAWTVKEYHRLSELGIFHPEERLELISGQIIKMAAKGTAHTATTRRTARLLQNLLGEQATVYTQDPVQLNNFSEPEPDIMVVIPDPLDYVEHHPTPPDIYWLIEVADSTLKYDCETKAKAYAASGIRDYWVLDVQERKLHIFRQPSPDGYQTEEIVRGATVVSPLAFPQVELTLGEMLS